MLMPRSGGVTPARAGRLPTTGNSGTGPRREACASRRGRLRERSAQTACRNKHEKGALFFLSANLKELPDLSELEEAFGLKEPSAPMEGY
jgi:hypothetical protein